MARANSRYKRTSQDRRAFDVSRATASFTQNPVTGQLDSGSAVEVDLSGGSPAEADVRANPTGAFPISIPSGVDLQNWSFTQDGSWIITVTFSGSSTESAVFQVY